MPHLFLFIYPLIIVTLDYKPLTMLSVKKNDEDFQLGGKGYGVEFCLLWNAIRISMSITENETD